MKRFFCLLLCLCLFLPGCSGELMKNPVTFYYPRREYQYGAEDGVISSEQREASGHADDLHHPVHHRRGRGHHHQRKPKRHHEPGQPDPH